MYVTVCPFQNTTTNMYTATNMYITRASCVKSSEAKWSECSVNMGTGSQVQVFFSWILYSSVGFSLGIQAAGDLVSETLGSNRAFSRRRQLVSFQFENHMPVPDHRNQQQQTCISPEPGAKANPQWGQVG